MSEWTGWRGGRKFKSTPAIAADGTHIILCISMGMQMLGKLSWENWAATDNKIYFHLIKLNIIKYVPRFF